MQDRTIYTVGHSDHSLAHFRDLLRAHRISTLIDVRSSPYSRRSPQFNRPMVASALNETSIRYWFAGRSFGGRPVDDSLYVDGHASYAAMALTRSFSDGLRRLVRMARDARIALMCAEAEPIECHRFLLVARALAHCKTEIHHILPDGTLEPHRLAEWRLLKATGLAQVDLFGVKPDALAEAYARQEARFAYRRPFHSERALWNPES